MDNIKIINRKVLDEEIVIKDDNDEFAISIINMILEKVETARYGKWVTEDRAYIQVHKEELTYVLEFPLRYTNKIALKLTIGINKYSHNAACFIESCAYTLWYEIPRDLETSKAKRCIKGIADFIKAYKSVDLSFHKATIK